MIADSSTPLVFGLSEVYFGFVKHPPKSVLGPRIQRGVEFIYLFICCRVESTSWLVDRLTRYCQDTLHCNYPNEKHNSFSIVNNKQSILGVS